MAVDLTFSINSDGELIVTDDTLNDQNINELTTVSTLANTDLFLIVNVSTNEGKVLSYSQLKDLLDDIHPPISHASDVDTYGLGTTRNYGHVKTVENLVTSSATNGLALGAYQGKLLNDLITSLGDTYNATIHQRSLMTNGESMFAGRGLTIQATAPLNLPSEGLPSSVNPYGVLIAFQANNGYKGALYFSAGSMTIWGATFNNDAITWTQLSN